MEQTTQAAPPDQTESRNQPSPPVPPQREFRSRPSRTAQPGFRIALIIGVVVLLVAAFFVYRYVTSYEDTDDAQVDGNVISISPRITGHVIKLDIVDNQYVQPGTVLVEIDPADYQTAYQQAKADYENAQAAAAAAGLSPVVAQPLNANNTARMSPQKDTAVRETKRTRLPLKFVFIGFFLLFFQK